MTINQVCHVIFEKKPEVVSVVLTALEARDLTEENSGKSSGLISDKFNNLSVFLFLKIRLQL